jgi:TFIIF-interacting CTD phosphatase-like protein
MSEPDFITQVRNPKDEVEDRPIAETNQSPEPSEVKPPKKSSWCGFLCCGSAYEEGSKRRPSNVKISINPTTQPIPPSNSDNDKYGINSPRMSGKYQPQGQGVYSDDHLLPPQNEKKKGKKCLVLDLDETLVHSSFKQVPCDFVVPVKIEYKTYKVFVA